jgi:hypothetical protein
MLKKYLLIVLLLILSGFVSWGKEQVEDSPWFTPKENLIGKKVYYELFGGISYPKMVFTNYYYNQIKRNSILLPDFGASVRMQFYRKFSFNPRLSYSRQVLSFNNGSNYQLKSNGITLSLPIDFQFQMGSRDQTSTAKLFFFFGPYIAVPFSENITTGSFSAKLKMGDLKIPDFGIDTGLGFRIPTFSLEGRSLISIRLSYFRGFVDTYSEEESKVNPLLNDRLYLNGGKRFNGGVKLILGVEIPKRNKRIISFTAGGDRNKTYKKIVIVDEK